MKTNQLRPGQLVTVSGKSGKFRFVCKNIVKDIKSGRVLSVKIADIQPSKKFNLSNLVKDFLLLLLLLWKKN